MKLPGRDGGDLPIAGPRKSKFRRGRLFVSGLILCAGAQVLSVFGVFCCILLASVVFFAFSCF